MVLRRLLKIVRKREIIPPERCPNCNKPLSGKFCSNCGQSVIDYHRPFVTIFRDVIGDLASFDNRLLKTLIPMLFRPGFLVKEFMAGRRMKYMPPFKLYLFVTFVAFLLLSTNHKPESAVDISDGLTFQNSDGESFRLDSLFNITKLSSDSIDYSSAKRDSVSGESVAKDSLVDVQEEVEDKKREDEIVDKIMKLGNMYKLNPGLVLDTAFKKLSQTLFVILPLFALFLALLYIRRKRYFIEHLLISVNFHSFIFLVIILSELLLMIGWSVTTDLAIYVYFAIPLRLFLALKFYYRQSWFKSFVKFVILSVYYNILIASAMIYSLLMLIE